MRTSGYPEYPALLLAAKQIGRAGALAARPGSEGFLTDNQARDTIIEAALALDADGRFLALDIDVLAAMGAYLTSHGAFIATVNFARCLPCMYDIPQIGLRIRCLFTNTVPTGPYRGAGRPEANYCARAAGRRGGAGQRHRPRSTLRRRNLIAPARMPYKTRGRHDLRQRRFPAPCSTPRSTAPTSPAFAARRGASEAAGKRRGLGVSCFLEIAGGQPGEGAAIEFPGQSKLLLAIGVQASGQGHRTLYRRLVAERLGIPVDAGRFRPWRQRRRRAERRRRRLALDDVGRRRGRRGDRRGHREGPAGRRACPRSRRGRHRLSRRRVRDRRHRPPHRRCSSWPSGRALAAKASSARASTPGAPPTRRRPSRTACHVAEVEIDPDTGHVDAGAPIPRSTIAAGCCSRCWSRARCRAGSRRASARRCSEWRHLRRRQRPAARRLVHGLRDAARRRPAADHRQRLAPGAVPPPTRSASKASARPAPPPRSPR